MTDDLATSLLQDLARCARAERHAQQREAEARGARRTAITQQVEILGALQRLRVRFTTAAVHFARALGLSHLTVAERLRIAARLRKRASRAAVTVGHEYLSASAVQLHGSQVGSERQEGDDMATRLVKRITTTEEWIDTQEEGIRPEDDPDAEGAEDLDDPDDEDAGLPEEKPSRGRRDSR